MTRIAGPPPRSNPIIRMTLRIARRKAAQMTGRETEQMIEPLEAFAHAPGLLLGYGMLELATERARRVEPRLKELAVLKAATIIECEYCIDIGSSVAHRTGISDEVLLALPRHSDSPLFSERERLALDLAVAMTRVPVAVPGALFAELREHFDEAQLVELTSVIALENLRSRFNAALDIGSAGLAEGMVCAVPERVANTTRDAAVAQNGAPASPAPA